MKSANVEDVSGSTARISISRVAAVNLPASRCRREKRRRFATLVPDAERQLPIWRRRKLRQYLQHIEHDGPLPNFLCRRVQRKQRQELDIADDGRGKSKTGGASPGTLPKREPRQNSIATTFARIARTGQARAPNGRRSPADTKNTDAAQEIPLRSRGTARAGMWRNFFQIDRIWDRDIVYSKRRPNDELSCAEYLEQRAQQCRAACIASRISAIPR